MICNNNRFTFSILFCGKDTNFSGHRQYLSRGILPTHPIFGQNAALIDTIQSVLPIDSIQKTESYSYDSVSSTYSYDSEDRKQGKIIENKGRKSKDSAAGRVRKSRQKRLLQQTNCRRSRHYGKLNPHLTVCQIETILYNS